MALLNLRLRHRDTISLCLVWPFLVCLADNVKKNPRIARTRFGELLFLLRVVSKKKKDPRSRGVKRPRATARAEPSSLADRRQTSATSSSLPVASFVSVITSVLITSVSRAREHDSPLAKNHRHDFRRKGIARSPVFTSFLFLFHGPPPSASSVRVVSSNRSLLPRRTFGERRHRTGRFARKRF